MSHAANSARIAFTIVAEAAALVYVTLLTWLMTAWFIDDHTASQMTENDWYLLAARRLAGDVMVAALLGAIVYGANRLVARVTGHRTSHVPRYSALAFAAVIFVAGLVAAIQFAVRKPFL